MHVFDQWKEIAERVKPNRKRLNIMSTLANGGLTPWGGGAPGDDKLPLCDVKDFGATKPKMEYVLCCGHTLPVKEAKAFVVAKLLTAGEPDKFGRPTLIITEDGKRWLSENWP